jgi:hypothetical protein
VLRALRPSVDSSITYQLSYLVQTFFTARPGETVYRYNSTIALSLSLSSSKLRAHLQFTIDTQECLLSSVLTKPVISPFSKKKQRRKEKEKPFQTAPVYIHTHQRTVSVESRSKACGDFHFQFYQSLTDRAIQTHMWMCERYSTRSRF